MLGGLRLEKHPDKTFIGRIERGFDFLGFHISRDGLTVAKKTVERFVARATRLYEQDRKELSGPSRLGMYLRRWVAWSGAGLGGAIYRSPTIRPQINKRDTTPCHIPIQGHADSCILSER